MRSNNIIAGTLVIAALSISSALMIFPELAVQAFNIISNKILSILNMMWDQFFNASKYEYLLIIGGCFLLDLIFLGYNKSALLNLKKMDLSTRNDVYIFIIGLLGIRHYFVMFSFLLIGYFSGTWIEINLAFNWLHSIDSPILQLLVYLLVYDFFDYWIHRFAHRVSWWWEVHRFHHSATKFNIITVGRSHPLDLALGGFISVIPMAMIGVPIEQIFLLSILRSMLGKMQHSMVDWDFGILGKYILMSPVAHRIHHSPYPEHWDKHYGHTFIFWDRFFGTYYDGNFVNARIGLASTTDNKKGLIHDIVTGQMNFFKAFFTKKWSFSVGVLTDAQRENYIRNNPHIETPVVDSEEQSVPLTAK